MVKMSLDHVQVLTGPVKEMKAATSANGDSSRGSWEEKEFERDDLGLTTTPKPVSPERPRETDPDRTLARSLGCSAFSLT